MLLALVDDKIVLPIKNKIGICPLCKSEVVAKCGETNVHHWAHKELADCDNWSEPETYWHKSWKEVFPKRNREFVFSKNNKKHFADIYTDDEIVIELQNSSISSETIAERENFYGNRMLWVINGSKYRSRIGILRTKEINDIILSKEKGVARIFKYFSNYVYLSDNNINEFIATNNEFSFHWEYPIRSWKNAKRPIFLDIGENYILWITEGIGTNYGTLKVYSKENFFEKYKGDYEKHRNLNKNENIENYSNLVEIIRLSIRKFNKELSNYSYPPELALKVIDKVTEKTHLRKLRWDNFIIPNSNNKGVFFLFCQNKNLPDENRVLIGEAIKNNIGCEIKNILSKDVDNKLYTIQDNNWIVQYFASIPILRNELDSIALPLINHLTDCLPSESILYLNHND